MRDRTASNRVERLTKDDDWTAQSGVGPPRDEDRIVVFVPSGVVDSRMLQLFEIANGGSQLAYPSLSTKIDKWPDMGYDQPATEQNILQR